MIHLKRKRRNKKGFTDALKQAAHKAGEELFNESVEPAYTKDIESSLYSINSKVNVQRRSTKWYEDVLGGAQERKFNENISLNNKTDARGEFYYLPEIDKSYNVITDVDFFSKGAEPFKGRTGAYIVFLW